MKKDFSLGYGVPFDFLNYSWFHLILDWEEGAEEEEEDDDYEDDDEGDGREQRRARKERRKQVKKSIYEVCIPPYDWHWYTKVFWISFAEGGQTKWEYQSSHIAHESPAICILVICNNCASASDPYKKRYLNEII